MKTAFCCLYLRDDRWHVKELRQNCVGIASESRAEIAPRGVQLEELLVEVADHVALRVDLDHVRVAAAVEDHVGLQEDDPLVPG